MTAWEDEKILLVVCEEGEIAAAVAALGSLNLKNRGVPRDTMPSGRVAIMGEGDTEVDLSMPAVIPVSSESSAYVYSEDDPSFKDPADQVRVPSESDLDGSDDEMTEGSDFSDFQDLDEVRKQRKIAKG